MSLPDTAVESRLDEVEELLPYVAGESTEARQERFGDEYREWIDEQNRLVETYGVFGAEYRPW